ncbi:cobalamin biosynthesis protein CbiX [Salmonella enterica subsp. enterica]|nr:cobalamin biosynthesis protein CbiX [Salmonella enterica subsp. enterica]
MSFTTFLNKYFDIEIVSGVFDIGKDAESIFIYEKGEDDEPLFILHESMSGCWIVGNVYSTLENGKEYSEKELRKMIKEGKITTKY